MLDARGTGMPTIVHWGADLGDLDSTQLDALCDVAIPAVSPSSIDGPLRLSLLPLLSEGWSGHQGLAGARDGSPATPSFTLGSVDLVDAAALTLHLADELSGLELAIHLHLDEAGVLALRCSLVNTGLSPFTLADLGLVLPLPTRAREVLDFSGRWAFERRPQRRALEHGTWSRQNRHGRTGHDSPLLLAAGTPGFGFRSGEVWSIHLAWSGDQEWFVESQPTGHCLLGASELLQPAEVTLAPGQTYDTPVLLAAWSASGLDGLAERHHARLRRRHPLVPRPVIMNTWEAVYFDHDLERLLALAEIGARVGVERFVLDDGWMTGRTDAERALGDWTVDRERWPGGLGPLIDRVLALGMDFGLWVEPEMVSLDSDLAREHPEWILGRDGDRLPQPWRHQYALDLGNPDAYANIFGQLCALLDEYPISYLKWDQNRDLLGGSSHVQTLSSWRLMDDLRARYPHLEIESCSSGGGRVDLGVLERTDRVWASDTNDALERQAIQRWTSLVVAPEFVGSHLGAPTAHTTGRSASLPFRLATALFVSAGIEWDLTRSNEAERAAIARWAAIYKEVRGLLHSGSTVHMDSADDAIHVHGVVSADRGEALVAYVSLGAARDAVAGPLLFAGLDDDAEYLIEVLDLGAPRLMQEGAAPWLERGSATLTGRAIREVGLAMPLLAPAQAVVLRMRRV